jgi:MraZ protein
MLVGEFFNKVGDKKRVALPKKFREEIGENVVLTRGFEGCITLVNRIQLDKLLKAFEDKPFTMSAVRDTRRFFVGGASEVILDKQGRFVIPENLLEYSQIKTEVVFIGLVDWVEIWSKEAWMNKLKILNENASQVAEDLERIYRDKD